MIHSGATDNEVIDWKILSDNVDFFDDPAAADGTDSIFSIEDIEQYLMNDESNGDRLVENHHDALTDEFLSDLLLDSPHGSGLGSELSKDSSSSPDSVVVEAQEEEEREEDSSHEKNGVGVNDNKVVDVGEIGDPADRKRKRQIRNRDAAVRSRERKKMYLRDLELKSKYYEVECKRLGTLLQCCLAENQALRLSLHNSNAFASMNKQESAVLLLESLLLGSLLGFLGIIYLLILSSQFLSNLEVALLENVGSEEWENAIPRKMGMEAHKIQPFDFLFIMGKRCKASRSRMRIKIIESSRSLLSKTRGNPVFSLLVSYHPPPIPTFSSS